MQYISINHTLLYPIILHLFIWVVLQVFSSVNQLKKTHEAKYHSSTEKGSKSCWLLKIPCSLKNHILAYLLNGELHCSNSLIGNGHQDLFEVVDLRFRHSDGDTVPLDEAKERRHIVVSYQYRDAAKPQSIHDPRTPCFVTTGTKTKFGCLESSKHA